jgi:O-6-methylguanine DNA methyltransferase
MLELFKDDFHSVIGTLYYIWKALNNCPEIVFLGNDRKAFDRYIEKLKIKFSDAELYNRKSEEVEIKISNYLAGRTPDIDLKPYFLTGSDFEKKIWLSTIKIPYGAAISYKELAQKAGFTRAWRAAGTALNHNPVMLIVPCHRVIKSSGEIGFFGRDTKIKEFLLNLENISKNKKIK